MQTQTYDQQYYLRTFYVAGRIKYKYYFFTVCVIKTKRTTGFHFVKKKRFPEKAKHFLQVGTGFARAGILNQVNTSQVSLGLCFKDLAEVSWTKDKRYFFFKMWNHTVCLLALTTKISWRS